jgi:hypothetical protein
VRKELGMPPARKRRPAAKQEAADQAVEDTTEGQEDEATEGEDEGEETPTRTRTPKVYAVKDAELANSLIGDDHDEISEGDEVTGEMLNSMRQNKAKWDSPEDGGIKHVFGMNSAIPLRNMLNKWLAQQDEDQLSIDDVDALYEAMISGQGWVTLAARTGASEADVRAALKDKVEEEHEVDITEGGRAYGKGDNWTWVTAEQLNDAKAANGNGSDEDEDEESDEDTEAEADDDTSDDTVEDDTDDEEEAPAPTRRRRRQNA